MAISQTTAPFRRFIPRASSAIISIRPLGVGLSSRKQRHEDILTYIAMLRLRGLKPPPFRKLPDETQADIKSLWTSYKGALEEANTFLFRMGKSELVREGCAQSPVGKLLPEDLYV